MTAEQLVEQSAKNGRVGHTFFGQVRSCPFGKVDVAAFEQAKRDGFLVMQSTRWGLVHPWKLHCAQQRQPCIRVEPRRRYAKTDQLSFEKPEVQHR